MGTLQCLFFQCCFEKFSLVYGAGHHIPICLRELMTIHIPPPPFNPHQGLWFTQFNPLEKLGETKTYILCYVEGFLGGTLLSEMDGAMQNKTICIEPNAQIYPRLFIILLEVKASKKEETKFFPSSGSFSRSTTRCSELLFPV